MSTCASHREYLGALADGETELVPAATHEHIKQCSDCAGEIQAHRLLAAKLREAFTHVNVAPSRHLPVSTGRRRIGLVAGFAAAVLAVAVLAAGWSLFWRADPVEASVIASSQPLQIQSADPSRVGDWCLNASGRGLPAIQLEGLEIVGARMDRVPSTDIVTVTYSAPSGARVTISWLEGQAPGGSGVEQKSVSGHPVLIVHTPRGTAVVAGSSSAAMWKAAATIESTLT